LNKIEHSAKVSQDRIWCWHSTNHHVIENAWRGYI